MNTIQKELMELISSKPEESYRVIIVAISESALIDLRLPGIHKLMDRIGVAHLLGTEVMELATNDSIISIELDAKMKAT